MDRLISENEVIKILILLFIDSENFKVAINSIKAIPSAEPYKGMTNGQVMQKIFKGVIHHIDGQPYLDYCYENQVNAFTLDWWNSPYNPQESEG